MQTAFSAITENFAATQILFFLSVNIQLNMDFPDPDEEFEFMHADELDYLREVEEEDSFVDTVPSSSKQNVTKTDETLAKPLSDNDNKRKIDKLFGDVLDISSDEECLNVPAKKNRICDKEDPDISDEVLIERILAQRKVNTGQEVSSTSDILQRKTACITRTLPPWPFVPVSNDEGKRVYVRLLTEEAFKSQVASVSTSGNCLKLLSEPFSVLERQAEELLEKKKIPRAAPDSNAVSEDAESSELWVEKYRPQSYLDLLSDEGTNRTLLKWMKLWDHVVFKKEIRKKKVRKDEAKEKQKNFQNPKFQNAKFQHSPAELAEELDDAGYPLKRIVLLCGPPGLGKTTLAHVVAEHAGYNVVEINASDDRSPEVFRNKLEAATSMQAVVGATPRPNCLVMDEIDGAPAPSIDVLLKVALGKDSSKGKGKKGNQKKTVLKRPIICICNDLYAPALRLLRQQALVIHFGSSTNTRLAYRLMEIAREQGIKTDMGALMVLCKKMQYDIRSCVSFLYLFKVQNKPLRMFDVQKSSVGLKDAQKSAFDVWQEIFKIHKDKSVTNNLAKDNSQAMGSPLLRFSEYSFKNRMFRVLKAVQSFGDYDRLSQGVFENYLSVKQKESSLREVSLGMDSFTFFDKINTTIMSQQTFFLYPYLPYFFVKWHFLFAENSWPKLTYPRSGYEAHIRLTNFNQTIHSLMEGLSPIVRSHISRSSLYLDVLPPLLTIISPPLRSVSIELYNQREKANFANLIKIMIDYNLTYIQERTPDGVYEYNLDPNVEEFISFPGMRASAQLPYNTKQIIAREIKNEIMKRFEMPAPSTPTSTAKKPLSTNHMQKLTPKALKKDFSVKVGKDFFGRAVEIDPKSEKKNMSTFIKSDIWYHFKEGYTNAVRRRVKIKDFL